MIAVYTGVMTFSLMFGVAVATSSIINDEAEFDWRCLFVGLTLILFGLFLALHFAAMMKTN